MSRWLDTLTEKWMTCLRPRLRHGTAERSYSTRELELVVGIQKKPAGEGGLLEKRLRSVRPLAAAAHQAGKAEEAEERSRGLGDDREASCTDCRIGGPTGEADVDDVGAAGGG